MLVTHKDTLHLILKDNREGQTYAWPEGNYEYHKALLGLDPVEAIVNNVIYGKKATKVTGTWYDEASGGYAIRNDSTVAAAWSRSIIEKVVAKTKIKAAMKVVTYGHDVDSDIKLAGCHNPMCITKDFMHELSSPWMEAVWSKMDDIGLVGLLSRNEKGLENEYLVDPVKDIGEDGKSPTFKNNKGDWVKLNNITHQLFLKWKKAKGIEGKVEKGIYWEIVNRYKLVLHDLLSMYWDEYKKARRNHTWFADGMSMVHNAHGNDVMDDHWDPAYDDRSIGKDVPVCPYCGDIDVFYARSKDVLEHECVVAEKGRRTDCEDVYVLMDPNDPDKLYTNDNVPFVYYSDANQENDLDDYDIGRVLDGPSNCEYFGMHDAMDEADYDERTEARKAVPSAQWKDAWAYRYECKEWLKGVKAKKATGMKRNPFTGKMVYAYSGEPAKPMYTETRTKDDATKNLEKRLQADHVAYEASLIW